MIYVKTRVSDRPSRPGASRPVAPLAATLRAAAAVGAMLLGAAPAPGLAQAAAEGQPQRLEAIALQAGMHRIRAEVALTPEQRQKGLMYRRDLGTHEGMLFVFEYPMTQCFWMKNTPTPLTIAFLADDGTVVNLADMQPLSEQSHCSTKPVRYVLEMNQGWFAKRGIKAGFKIGGAPFDKR